MRVRRECRKYRSSAQADWSSTSFLAIADLRFAAWFLWMTPLETALSSLREATCSALVAASTLPDSTASRNLRTWVRSSDLTALLRWCAFSFCLLRLICDLMFATRDLSFVGYVSLLDRAQGTPLPAPSGMRQREKVGANAKDSRPAALTSNQPRYRVDG